MFKAYARKQEQKVMVLIGIIAYANSCTSLGFI